MNVESRLIELIGEPGRRLHTARSRNDQVATDLRLYARRAARRAGDGDRSRARGAVPRAREHADTLLPGYTHLQRAQAVTLGHHLLAYAEMLGAIAGGCSTPRAAPGSRRWARARWPATGLPIDRAQTAAALGFDGPTHNSLDAVSDRDFAAEIAFACALLGVHLSRLGEELVLWSTTEFGFVRLGEGYCSGSSLMPQKRNPDIAELLRAKPARVIGDVVALLTISKGLALAYNKDLQETQEPFYDAVETARVTGRAAGVDRGAGVRRPSAWRRRGGGSGARAPPIWPRSWCAAACRSARRTRSWAAWSGAPKKSAFRCASSTPTICAAIETGRPETLPGP